MSDASCSCDSEYDSDAHAECKDIESEHSTDSDYDDAKRDPPPIARKKQVHSPLETFSGSCKHTQDAEKNGMDSMNASALIGMVAPRTIKQSTQSCALALPPARGRSKLILCLGGCPGGVGGAGGGGGLIMG